MGGPPRRSEHRPVLNDAGVICGPIYTIADIFEDPHFQARDMLLEHVTPSSGIHRARDRPEALRDAGRVRWSAPWEHGSHNKEVYGELLGLSEDELDGLKEEGVI